MKKMNRLLVGAFFTLLILSFVFFASAETDDDALLIEENHSFSLSLNNGESVLYKFIPQNSVKYIIDINSDRDSWVDIDLYDSEMRRISYFSLFTYTNNYCSLTYLSDYSFSAQSVYYLYFEWDIDDPEAHISLNCTIKPFSEENKCGDDAFWSFDESAGELFISGTGAMWDFARIPWNQQSSDIKAVFIQNGITKIGANSFRGEYYSLCYVDLPDSIAFIDRYAFENRNVLLLYCSKDSKAEYYAKLYGLNYTTEQVDVLNPSYEIEDAYTLEEIGKRVRFRFDQFIKFVPVVDGIYTLKGFSENSRCEVCFIMDDEWFDGRYDSASETGYYTTGHLIAGKEYFFRLHAWYNDAITAWLTLDQEHSNLIHYSDASCAVPAGVFCPDCNSYIQEYGMQVIPHTDADLDRICDVCGKSTEISSGWCSDDDYEDPVYWHLYDNGDLEITGHGWMGEYSDSSWEGWKYPPYSEKLERPIPWTIKTTKYDIRVKRVVINEGIQHIGQGAFLNFEGLTSVVLPQSLVSIGACAFDGCVNLSSITIGAGVQEIGDSAFGYCGGRYSHDTAIEGFRIFGSIGSEAERYAMENGISFAVFCNHTYTSDITTRPTCTTPGVRTYTCTSCAVGTEGHTYTESIPALNHAYGAWETVKAATCEGEGTEQRVCANNGSHKETRSIDALGHIDKNNDGKCDRCNLRMSGDTTTHSQLNACKWCGKVHTGFLQKIIGFFHSIFARILGAKFNADGTPVKK